MLAIMLTMLAAAAGLGVSERFRVPSIPLMIVAGVLLGVTGWMGGAEDLRDILLLGLTFVLFVLGAELDLAVVGDRARAAAGFGLVQFVLLSAIGIGAGVVFGFGLRAGLYIGLAIASSSTLVVVTLLRRRERFFEPFGRMAVGVVLLQDVLVILLLPLLIGVGVEGSARGLGATLGLIGLAWVCKRWLAPMLILRLERDQETLLLVVLATLFGFLGLAHGLGVPVVSGAFLAGIALSRFPVSGLVRGQIASLSDFFLAVFFVTLGVFLGTITHEIDLGLVIVHTLVLGGAMLAALAALAPLARRFGLTTRASIEITNLFAQCGELSLVVVLLGLGHGHIGEQVLGTVVLLAVLTMSLSPLLSSEELTWWILQRLPGAGGAGGGEGAHSGHLVFLGCGTSTRALIARASAAGQAVVAVDESPDVVRMLRDEGIEAIRGDGGDPWLLRRIGLREARLVISTLRRRRDNERVIRVAGGAPVIVRTFEPVVGEALRARGATVVVESDAAADRFMSWYEGFLHEASADGSQGSAERGDGRGGSSPGSA
jgi:CPA2 family monovalent cation:H+ antiporter-2